MKIIQNNLILLLLTFVFLSFMNDNEYFKVGQVEYNLRNKNDRVEDILFYMTNYDFKESAMLYLYPEDYAITVFELKFTNKIEK